MTNSIEEVWTALPNGFTKDGSLVKLSLLVTFRLTTDTNPAPNSLRLTDFIGGWTENNWTRTVRGYTFKVDLGKGPITVYPKNDWDEEMWKALFGNPDAVKVKPYVKPSTGDDALSKAEILTYRSGELSTQLETAYVELANVRTRFRNADRLQAAVALRAEQSIATLVDGVNVYSRSNHSEEDRLNALWQLRRLESATAGNVKATAYRDLYLGRISRNGGRDLRIEALREIHLKIQQQVPEIVGPEQKAPGEDPGGVILFRAQPQASPQPSAQPQQTGTVDTDFAMFHSPLPEAVHPPSEQAAPRPDPVFDFHEMLTMVGNYPVIMRRLGLVIDVEIDPNELTTPEGIVQVTQPPGKSQHPRTAYNADLNTHKFVAKSTTPEIKDGLLDLTHNNLFTIQSFDVDGALMKHLANVSNAPVEDFAGSQNPFADVTDDELQPTLRTLGISVLFEDFTAFLRKLLDNAEKKSCESAGCLFHAEDLIKGLRVDIQEVDSANPDAGKWYSVCQRDEKYHFLNADDQDLFEWPPGSAMHPAEGTLGLTVTKPEVQQSVEAANLKVLQQHQSLFRWENWSLVVPFPQTALDVKRVEVTPGKSPLRLRPEFKVTDRSLPKLRFGRQYRVRCRVVDPAGNSLSKDDVRETDYSTTIGPEKYGRYEAVAPPLLLVTRGIDPEKTPGEQLNRLVLRDGDGSSLRCVAPPRVTAMTSIIAGQYDNGVSPKDSAFVGALLEKNGEFPQVESDDHAYESPLFSYLPDNAEPPEQPYLPDPFAPAACVALGTVDEQPIFDNMSKNEMVCGFFKQHESWPHAQPFLINLVPADPKRETIAELVAESPMQPFVTMAEVSLTPGEIIKLKVSSSLANLESGSFDMSNLEKMAYWKLAAREGRNPSPEQAQRILCGEYALYTPPRDVLLVHAVKKPLEPLLKKLVGIARKPGDTFLNLDINVELHRNSTGKAECEARWEEPVDDVSQPICGKKHGTALVAERKIQLVDKDNPITKRSERFRQTYHLDGLHNFNDTKHRNVTYSMRATTRFREYYPPAEPVADGDTEALMRAQQKEQATYSTVFSETEVNVLSTARPPAPNLAYVIPTFRWEQDVIEKTGSNSRRWGGGLRVYLERPWFASGAGERLGIVLYPGTLTGPLCKFMGPHITQWGRDPIWGLKPKSGNFPERRLSAFPGRNDFRWRGKEPLYQTGLMLEAFEKLKPADVDCISGEQFQVAVVAFEPEFDEERGMWRCDIEMNPGTAYFPFVRLALARYQPDALDAKENDCRISSVVQAEFMQLTPDRWANLKYESDHDVTVTVTGYSYQSRRARQEGLPEDGTGIVKVAVEERCKNRKGDLRWQRLTQPGGSPDGHIDPTSTSSSANGETIWTFRVSLPHSRKASRYRIVILESEEIAQDKDHDHIEYDPGFRIVYADVLGV